MRKLVAATVCAALLILTPGLDAWAAVARATQVKAVPLPVLPPAAAPLARPAAPGPAAATPPSLEVAVQGEKARFDGTKARPQEVSAAPVSAAQAPDPSTFYLPLARTRLVAAHAKYFVPLLVYSGGIAYGLRQWPWWALLGSFFGGFIGLSASARIRNRWAFLAFVPPILLPMTTGLLRFVCAIHLTDISPKYVSWIAPVGAALAITAILSKEFLRPLDERTLAKLLHARAQLSSFEARRLSRAFLGGYEKRGKGLAKAGGLPEAKPLVPMIAELARSDTEASNRKAAVAVLGRLALADRPARKALQFLAETSDDARREWEDVQSRLGMQERLEDALASAEKRPDKLKARTENALRSLEGDESVAAGMRRSALAEALSAWENAGERTQRALAAQELEDMLADAPVQPVGARLAAPRWALKLGLEGPWSFELPFVASSLAYSFAAFAYFHIPRLFLPAFFHALVSFTAVASTLAAMIFVIPLLYPRWRPLLELTVYAFIFDMLLGLPRIDGLAALLPMALAYLIIRHVGPVVRETLHVQGRELRQALAKAGDDPRIAADAELSRWRSALSSREGVRLKTLSDMVGVPTLPLRRAEDLAPLLPTLSLLAQFDPSPKVRLATIHVLGRLAFKLADARVALLAASESPLATPEAARQARSSLSDVARSEEALQHLVPPLRQRTAYDDLLARAAKASAAADTTTLAGRAHRKAIDAEADGVRAALDADDQDGARVAADRLKAQLDGQSMSFALAARAFNRRSMGALNLYDLALLGSVAAFTALTYYASGNSPLVALPFDLAIAAALFYAGFHFFHRGANNSDSLIVTLSGFLGGMTAVYALLVLQSPFTAWIVFLSFLPGAAYLQKLIAVRWQPLPLRLYLPLTWRGYRLRKQAAGKGDTGDRFALWAQRLLARGPVRLEALKDIERDAPFMDGQALADILLPMVGLIARDDVSETIQQQAVSALRAFSRRKVAREWLTELASSTKTAPIVRCQARDAVQRLEAEDERNKTQAQRDLERLTSLSPAHQDLLARAARVLRTIDVSHLAGSARYDAVNEEARALRSAIDGKDEDAARVAAMRLKDQLDGQGMAFALAARAFNPARWRLSLNPYDLALGLAAGGVAFAFFRAPPVLAAALGLLSGLALIGAGLKLLIRGTPGHSPMVAAALGLPLFTSSIQGLVATGFERLLLASLLSLCAIFGAERVAKALRLNWGPAGVGLRLRFLATTAIGWKASRALYGHRETGRLARSLLGRRDERLRALGDMEREAPRLERLGKAADGLVPRLGLLARYDTDEKAALAAVGALEAFGGRADARAWLQRTADAWAVAARVKAAAAGALERARKDTTVRRDLDALASPSHPEYAALLDRADRAFSGIDAGSLAGQARRDAIAGEAAALRESLAAQDSEGARVTAARLKDQLDGQSMAFALAARAFAPRLLDPRVLSPLCLLALSTLSSLLTALSPSAVLAYGSWAVLPLLGTAMILARRVPVAAILAVGAAIDVFMSVSLISVIGPQEAAGALPALFAFGALPGFLTVSIFGKVLALQLGRAVGLDPGLRERVEGSVRRERLDPENRERLDRLAGFAGERSRALREMRGRLKESLPLRPAVATILYRDEPSANDAAIDLLEAWGDVESVAVLKALGAEHGARSAAAAAAERAEARRSQGAELERLASVAPAYVELIARAGEALAAIDLATLAGRARHQEVSQALSALETSLADGGDLRVLAQRLKDQLDGRSAFALGARAFGGRPLWRLALSPRLLSSALIFGGNFALAALVRSSTNPSLQNLALFSFFALGATGVLLRWKGLSQRQKPGLVFLFFVLLPIWVPASLMWLLPALPWYLGPVVLGLAESQIEPGPSLALWIAKLLGVDPALTRAVEAAANRSRLDRTNRSRLDRLGGFAGERRSTLIEMRGKLKEALPLEPSVIAVLRHDDSWTNDAAAEMLEGWADDASIAALEGLPAGHSYRTKAQEAAARARERRKNDGELERLVAQARSHAPTPNEALLERAAAARAALLRSNSLASQARLKSIDEAASALAAALEEEDPDRAAIEASRLEAVLRAPFQPAEGANAFSPARSGSFLIASCRALAYAAAAFVFLAAASSVLLLSAQTPILGAAVGASTAALAARDLLKKDKGDPRASVQLAPPGFSEGGWPKAKEAFDGLMGRLGVPAASSPRLGIYYRDANPEMRPDLSAITHGASLGPEATIGVGERWLSRPKEELSALIAHELMHLKGGDLRWTARLRRLSLASRFGAAAAILGTCAVHLLWPLVAISCLGWLAIVLLELAHSRRLELRADRRAADVVGAQAVAGMVRTADSWGMVGHGFHPLATHPSLPRRLKNLSAR